MSEHGPFKIFGVTSDYREDVLRWASRITSDRRNPTAVRANALPLRNWLDSADGTADLRARWIAMDQHEINIRMGKPQWTEVRTRWGRRGYAPVSLLDDPAAFVAAAQVLHRFLTAEARRVS